MQLTTTSFKKAAKRLAAKHSFALNVAQESLAEAFGFGNFDAALSSIDKRAATGEPVDPTQAAASAPPPASWLGLNALQFITITESLVQYGEDVAFAHRGRALLEMVVLDQFKLARLRGGQVQCADVRMALGLPHIEARAWRDEPDPRLPRALELAMYLQEMLLGYRPERYGDQSEETHRHHNWLASPLVYAVSRLEYLEREGGLHLEELAKLPALADSLRDGTNGLARVALRSLLDRCVYAG